MKNVLLRIALVGVFLAAAFEMPVPALSKITNVWWCHFDEYAVDCVSISHSCLCVQVVGN